MPQDRPRALPTQPLRQQRLCCPWDLALFPPLEAQPGAHSEAVVRLEAAPCGGGDARAVFPRIKAVAGTSVSVSACLSSSSWTLPPVRFWVEKHPPFRSPCLPNSCPSSW